jgi:3alpha(or 20beta)-hydroxysteroid dehydrogenase
MEKSDWRVMEMGNRSGRLKGKLAIVTGGARGQGEEMCRVFTDEGARVLVCDIRDPEGETVALSLGGAATYRHLDVTSEAGWRDVIDWCVGSLGDPTVLVNNAGIVRTGSLEGMSLEDYRAVVDVNQIGCFLGMRSIIGAMRRAGGGSIINFSSVAGLHGVKDAIAYSASKYAVRGMTRSAAIELGGYAIRVNSIHPGTIDTPMVNTPEFAHVDRSAYFSAIPARRMGQPRDVAMLALFLASDESGYCTGSEFVVDGGSSTGTRV